jgi:hypothetical protein
MFRPNLRRWSIDQNLDMLLFFVQSLDELLFDYTIDSYKASALNTHTVLIELRFLAGHLHQQRIKAGTLIPVIEEFKSKIKHDPVLDSNTRNTLTTYISRLENERTKPERFLSTIEALLMEFTQFYWDRLLDSIMANVRISNNKKTIRSLANTFVAEAELQGFNRSFIYHYNKIYFFGHRDIESVEVLIDFLSRFSEPERKYDFIFKASSTFFEMKDFCEPLGIKIQDTIPSLDLPYYHRNTKEYLAINENFPAFVIVKDISARDEINARLLAEYSLENLSALYTYHIHRHEPKWQRQCLCIRQDSTFQSILNPPVSPMKRQPHKPVNDCLPSINKTIELISGRHFQHFGTFVIGKSLEYHRAAVEANTPENQLLDLWAAVEGFLPPPDPDSDRISHYVSVLMPSLTLTYPQKIFNYITNTLYKYDPAVVALIDRISPNASAFENTICLLSSKDRGEERIELYSILGRDPLLRFRCFTIHDQYKSRKHIKNTLYAHRERVSWHIQRIYTTRNSIVHNAEALPYLNTLVENLHSYFDLLMDSITKVGIVSQRVASIEGALKLLNIHEQQYFHDLESDDQKSIECDDKNYKQLIFGYNNPMSPFHESLAL